MFDTFFLYLFCVVKIGIVYSHDVYHPENNLIIGFLKKREVIPLNPLYRRYGGNFPMNLNYRRTTDIREEVVDRRFETTELQVREAENMENHSNDLHSQRWITIDTENGIGIGI